MSKVSRIEMLKSFAEQEPDNPFNFYALALEYTEIDPNSASDYFKKLLKDFPDYLPTYFHAGAFFDGMGEISVAKEIFETGISLAEKQNDIKAYNELKNSYQNFMFENDLS